MKFFALFLLVVVVLVMVAVAGFLVGDASTFLGALTGLGLCGAVGLVAVWLQLECGGE